MIDFYTSSLILQLEFNPLFPRGHRKQQFQCLQIRILPLYLTKQHLFRISEGSQSCHSLSSPLLFSYLPLSFCHFLKCVSDSLSILSVVSIVQVSITLLSSCFLAYILLSNNSLIYTALIMCVSEVIPGTPQNSLANLFF